MSINEPAYPPHHDPKTHASGFTKLEMASLMMAQSILMNPALYDTVTDETEEQYAHIAKVAKWQAKAVLEECAK
jgi:hypothetical protein